MKVFVIEAEPGQYFGFKSRSNKNVEIVNRVYIYRGSSVHSVFCNAFVTDVMYTRHYKSEKDAIGGKKVILDKLAHLKAYMTRCNYQRQLTPDAVIYFDNAEKYINSFQIKEVDVEAPNFIKQKFEVYFNPLHTKFTNITNVGTGRHYCHCCGMCLKGIPCMSISSTVAICAFCISHYKDELAHMVENMNQEFKTAIEAERFTRML